MNKSVFIFILLASIVGSLLRFFIDNNFVISIVGSFFFGFIISKKLSKSNKEILLTGFCSCFTSFSGFIYYLYNLINKEDFLKIFLYLNIVIILNLLIMYFGFLISRKIT